jgi:hypothetical protein
LATFWVGSGKFLEYGNGRLRQYVSPLISPITGVSFDPLECYPTMPTFGSIKSFPQITVLDLRFLLVLPTARFPAVILPPLDPLSNPTNHVLAIGIQ